MPGELGKLAFCNFPKAASGNMGLFLTQLRTARNGAREGTEAMGEVIRTKLQKNYYGSCSVEEWLQSPPSLQEEYLTKYWPDIGESPCAWTPRKG